MQWDFRFDMNQALWVVSNPSLSLNRVFHVAFGWKADIICLKFMEFWKSKNTIRPNSVAIVGTEFLYFE